jgi:hypothetical protein
MPGAVVLIRVGRTDLKDSHRLIIEVLFKPIGSNEAV